MKPYGWDVQICYYCNGAARAARLVGKAAIATPPEKPSPNDLPTPNGPLDFGVTGAEFLQWAYMGTNDFVKDPGMPQKQLRLIANVQEPTFLIVAVTAESGITDLRQVQEKRMPVKVVSNRGIGGDITPTVLEYYGLTKEKLAPFGGSIAGTLDPKTDANVFIGFGSVAQVPEFSVFYQAAQRYDLKYLTIPPDLKTKLIKQFNLGEAQLPIGMFGKVRQPVSTVTRMGTSIFARTDMPDDFAYTLAKALDEHQEMLAWTQMNWSYNRHTIWKNFDVPLHPGAARYYKEVGYMK
jgi:TRAP transporter TAXI family solute receptor